MKRSLLGLLILLMVSSCNWERPTEFSEGVLNDELITISGNSTTLNQVLEANKGKDILIDIWATWCKDCMVGFPDVRDLQKQFPDVQFIFLSVDRNANAWKRGVEKYQLKGEHYYIASGWDGVTGDFVRLNWIPRYMVIDKNGKIKLFKATKATDKRIKDALL
ncbi:MAG: TlpA family protein disulfide reductase [Flavobacteriaceae bacterium]|nr:TlpA family protein disulfide reductase [Flavobacteriaceae bacterium]